MTSWLLLLIGLVLLYYGAEFLIKGAVSCAAMIGVTPLAIGLTVVAFGTSAPELTVSLSAVLAGSGDISAGNVIGSNIFNIACILGITALICPIHITWQIIRFDVPVMIAVSILGTILILDARLSRIDGAVLFACVVAYTFWTLKASRKAKPETQQEAKEQVPQKTYSMPFSISFVVFGLLMLVGGSKLFVSGAVSIARSWNISEAVIGLTIVSIGTSLPELATSVVAALRRQSDIAVGNIVGSNIFNILAILGITALVRPYSVPGIRHSDLFVMLLAAIILLPLMWTKFKLNRVEGSLLLAIYVGYMVYLWS